MTKHAASAPTFTAIDFETATTAPDSACAIGLVRVESGRVVTRASRLIKPRSRTFEFTYLHGIAWSDVATAGTFEEVWGELRGMCDGVDFLAARNASFDQRVLRACCEQARHRTPTLPFTCTVALARQVWGIYPTRLDCVAKRLGIALRHHDAMSDAEACASIVVQAHAANGNAGRAKVRA